MKSGKKVAFLLLWLLWSVIQMRAQNYTLQYWFNDNFAAAQTQLLSAADAQFTNVSIVNVPTPYAVNKLCYRVIDNQGCYSSVTTTYYYKGMFGTDQPTLEYWYNNDCLSASKMVFPITKDDSFTDLSIPSQNIPFGINKISFRFTDGLDNRSSVASFIFVRGFFGTRKTVAEYWFDNNYEQKTRIPVTDNIQKLEFNANIDNLSVGVHTMHVWAGYENGLFTAPQTSYFLKLSNGEHKSLLEYWFDDNVTNKVQKKIGAWENMIEMNLDVTALTSGTHKLSVRAGNENGILSPVATTYFFKGINKYQVPVTGSKVVNYRYWFDENKASYVSGTIHDVTQEITFLKEINANTLDKGKHNVSIQFQNSQGQWSDVAYGEFEKRGNRVITVPQLKPNKVIISSGTRLEFSGYQFSKYGKLMIECRKNDFLRRDTLYANKYGRIEHGLIMNQPGTYLVKATDLETNISNVGYYVKVISTTLTPPSTYMKLIFPDFSSKISVGNIMYIRWSDIMKIDSRYPLDHSSVQRGYEYDVEVEAFNGEKRFSKTISGTAGFEQIANFVADVTFEESGQYKVIIRDTYTNSYIQSDIIEVTNNTGITRVNTEWDYSILKGDGTYHRMGHPKGVAADGTGRIYLTVESNLKTISQVNVTLTDGVNNSAELLGRIMPATITNCYSNEANDAMFTIASSNKMINMKHWFWYVAPIDFVDGNTQNNTSSEREVIAQIVVTFDDLSTETIDYPIKIVRPTIMLVHGLGSNAEKCWGKFSLHTGTTIFQDPLYKSVRAIDIFPDLSFERNAKGLLGEKPKTTLSTFNTVLKDLRIQGYSSNRVDYICHSMGGCVLRYASNNLAQKFYSDENYGKGYTNKVITINTPHDGSPWPDAIQFMLDMFYDDKYVSIANNVIPYIYNLNDLYEKYRDDNTGINPFWFIRPTQIEQNKLQVVANWGYALFDINWQPPLIRKFTLSPAVRDLGMENGIRFNASTTLKAHMIASDVISGEQNWPKIGPIESQGLDYFFSFNKNMKKFLGYWAEIGEMVDRFNITETGVIKFEPYSQIQRLDKEFEEIMLLNDPSFKLMSYFDTFLKRVNGFIKVSNGASFLINSDLIVPYRSQIAGAELLSNHTTIKGITQTDISDFTSLTNINDKIIQPILNVNHLAIVDNNEVQNRIADLLNTSIKDIHAFNGIPGYVEEPYFIKRNSFENEINVIKQLRTSATVDTSKISIIEPANNVLINADTNLGVTVMVKDTVNLQSITAYFQGGTYSDASKEQGYIFNIPVNGDLINDQQLVVKATYYDSQKDSSYLAYSGRIICITPTENPVSFKVNDKVLTMSVGDTVHTSYETIYSRSIYKFSIEKNLMVSIDNPSLVEYDPANGNFIAKSVGNTFAEVSYIGLRDTIYFVMDETKEITSSLQKHNSSQIETLSFSVYPNPAKSFTTITSSENIKRIELCDVSGKIIQDFTVNSTNYLLNLNKLPKGVYLIKALTEGGVKVERLIKE